MVCCSRRMRSLTTTNLLEESSDHAMACRVMRRSEIWGGPAFSTGAALRGYPLFDFSRISPAVLFSASPGDGKDGVALSSACSRMGRFIADGADASRDLTVGSVFGRAGSRSSAFGSGPFVVSGLLGIFVRINGDIDDGPPSRTIHQYPRKPAAKATARSIIDLIRRDFLVRRVSFLLV